MPAPFDLWWEWAESRLKARRQYRPASSSPVLGPVLLVGSFAHPLFTLNPLLCHVPEHGRKPGNSNWHLLDLLHSAVLLRQEPHSRCRSLPFHQLRTSRASQWFAAPAVVSAPSPRIAAA